MAVQVNPITQSLPATTAIQDPATRRFAQAVEDALRALRSEEGAVESLKKAADAMNNAVAGGTPPSIAQWLFSSELYQKLTTEIARVDTQAKQDVLDEALARQTAIDEINATLSTIQSTAAYDSLVTYAVGDMVTYDGKLYQAILETTGNLPTNTTYWKKVGDYATLGDVVAAHTLEINDLESRVTTDEGNLTAEIANRQALATQLRGSYTGTDVNLVSQGLIYSERVARATADSNEVAARQSLSAKLTGSNDPSGLTLETLASGLIFDERQARVSGDGANASSISALRAQVGVTEEGALTTGLILDEKNVRASNDLAIVSAVNTALAQITGVSTSISQSGENLVANWTTAQANKWNQIEAEVLTSGGQTIRAALLQESQTRANLEGDVYASYTLRVDANGNIAGFGLAADENSSEFIVRADKFAVVTDTGGTPHVPFAIGPSGADFLGNVTGTVNGTSASTLVSTANTALTNANAAQTAANTANASLADIAADNKLTPAEKKSVRKEWDAIYAERAGIRAQADSFGITTEKTNYDNDFQALGTYLNGGTAYTIGATPPSWITDANLAVTTTIVGTTFRAYWSNLYSTRQALLNKISAEAAKNADWGNVQSRPSDEDILNAGSNLILNPDLRNSPAGDGTTAKGWVFNANSGTFYYRGVLQDSANGPPFDSSQPMFYAATTGADGQVSWIADEYIPVDADRNYTVSAWLRRYSGNPSAYLGVICYDAAYASLRYLYPAGLANLNNTSLSTSWEHRYGVFGPGHTAFPADTKFVRVVWWGTYLSVGATLATRFCFNEGVVPSRSVVPLDSSLINKINPITPSNVTTYIANAAIGNAQIANASITNAKIANATILAANIADGNITNAKIANAAITNAKIGNAAVNTLQIAGNAVTIPVHSRPADVSGIGGTFVNVASVWIDALGSTVSLFASASVRAGSGETATVTIRVLAPNGSTIGGGTGASTNGAYAHLSCVTSSTLAGTYTLQASKAPGLDTGYATNISLFALGTKR